MAYGASKDELARLILPQRLAANSGGSLVGLWTPDRSIKNWASASWDASPQSAVVVAGSLGRSCINGTNYWLNIGNGSDFVDWNLNFSTITLVGKGFVGTTWIRATPSSGGDWSSWNNIALDGAQINVVSASVVQYGTALGRAAGSRDGPVAVGLIFNGKTSGGGPMYVVGRGGQYATTTFPNETLRNGLSQWNFGPYVTDAGSGTSADRPKGELYGTAFWSRAMALGEMQARLAEMQAMLDGLEDPSFHSLAAAVQTAYPSADSAAGSWLPSAGVDLYACVDEVSASDTDYIYTGAATTCGLTLQSLTDPVSSTGHIVHYRCLVLIGTITVRLKQGSTTIATWSHTVADASTMTTFNQTLSSGEANSITDYTSLKLEFETS